MKLISNVFTRFIIAALAVMAFHATLNRVRSPAHPDTVCSVVWQNGQFAWTEDGKSDRMTELDAIGKAVDVALAASRRQIKDPTGGALYY